MKTTYPEHWPQFYTATIYKWKHLLQYDKNKELIIESLGFLVAEKRIELNAFVIMSNHTCRQAGSPDLATYVWLFTFRYSGIFYEIHCTAIETFA